MKIVNNRNKQYIEESMSENERLWNKQSQEKLDVTASLIKSAYVMANMKLSSHVIVYFYSRVSTGTGNT